MRALTLISFLNTCAAWAMMAYIVYKAGGEPVGSVGMLTMFLLATFAIDRGFRHLDIRAGALSARIDGDQAVAVQTTTTTTVAPAPAADLETKS